MSVVANEPSNSDLSRLLNQQTFLIVDDAEFERSRLELVQALRNPASDIDPDEWDYLRTNSVADSLEDESPELSEWLNNLVEKLNQNYSPYEEPRLLELRRLVRRHLRMIDNRANREELQEEFLVRKKAILDSLAAFLESGDEQSYRQLAADIRWMDTRDIASDFVHLAKQRLSYPNFEAQLPASLVRSVTATTLPTQTETINRNSDGIQTVGSGVFTSHAFLKPITSVDRGSFHLTFSGAFQLSATNTLRRVRFRSNATTHASATGAIGMDHAGYLSYDNLQVCTQTQLCNGKACVDRRIGKNVIGRLVDRVVAKKAPEVEQSLSQELRERVQDELGTQITDLVRKANATVNERLRSPARRLDIVPRDFSVSTSNNLVHIRMLEDMQCGLAAPSFFGGDDHGAGYAAMHTSLLEDLMNGLYVRQKQPSELNGDLVQRLNTSLPVQPFSNVSLPEIHLSIVLDFPRPFELDFENGLVHLTVKAKRLLLDHESYPGRDLTLSYRVVAQADNQIRFALQAPPRLSLLKDEDPSVTQELTQAVRDELLAGLLPGFSLNLEDLISGDRETSEKQSLPIKISSIAAQKGWLVLSLAASPNGGISLVQN